MAREFERSVFINCPFDDEFAPLLQAIAFCVTNMGFHPRLAPENADAAASRLDRIVALIRNSKYAIHDLSRCKAASSGEYARMNMPFELGIDYGAKRFGQNPRTKKAILVLEHTRFDFQKTLSDISGWDIHAHKGEQTEAIRHVSTWLRRQAGAPAIGPDRILSDYATFQKWYWDIELALGASEEDIKAYPTIQMVDAMQKWVDNGRPS